VKYANKNASTYVRGTTPHFLRARNFEIDNGRFFNQQDMKMKRSVAVLGTTVKKDLFGEGTPLGQHIKINGVNFLVIGVMKTKGQTSWRDPDDQIFIPPDTFLKRLFSKKYIDDIYVQIDDVVNIEEAKSEIEVLLRRRHRIPPGEESDFNVRDYTEFLTAMKETSRTFTVLLGGTAVISLLVGGIGVMNIMLVSVTERTREIGIRMAVGAKKRDILKQFLIEAVVLTIIGGIAGVAFGILVAVIISLFGLWETVVTTQSIFLAASFSAAIGLIFGLYPARKASLLNPIDALRYE
jgi:ABC-type antimicrobial peptide transport system permease subunit